MSAIRFFMDEDVYGAVAPAMRRSGIDIRRLLRLASVLDAESMRDRLEFLSDW
jgi:hypothetical protein